MKTLIQGEIAAIAAKYEAKIEGGQLDVIAQVDLVALVDKGAEVVPGDSVMEQLIVGLVKQAVKAL